ncbi:hypothetical protein TMatcc_009163 [Talaromyces marneffei ATCC 18224]
MAQYRHLRQWTRHTPDFREVSSVYTSSTIVTLFTQATLSTIIKEPLCGSTKPSVQRCLTKADPGP